MNGSSKTPLILKVGLAICVQLLLILAFEIGMRVYVEQFAERQTFLRYASLHQLEAREGETKPIYSSHPYLGHFPTPSYAKGKNKHNTLGYRGDVIVAPKPAGEFRIVCLGGSTTYTSKVLDYTLSYPYRLGVELRSMGFDDVNVINAGASGWSSFESLINFELRVLELEPDLVIVYHGINDVHPRLVWPPEFYRGDNSGRRGAGVPMFMPNVLEYSTLLRIAGVELGMIQGHSDFRRSVLKSPPHYFGDQFRDQRFAGEYPRGIFEQASAEEMLRTNRPVYFQRNIENLIAIASSRGVNVLAPSFAFHSGFKDHPRASSPEYVAAYLETNEMLRRVAEGSGLHFFDFASAFPQDRTLYVDGRHVTIQGANLKAKLFARFVADNEMIVH